MNDAITRRRLLELLAGAAGAAAVSPARGQSTGKMPVLRTGLGICIDSYGIARGAAVKQGGGPFRGAAGFLDFCHQRGAGGIQMRIDPGVPGGPARLRSRAEQYGMFVEGQVGMPATEADVTRFDRDVRAAKEAGAQVIRTAKLGGRRYETFDSAEAFARFDRRSWHSLTLAEPIVKKHRVRLAVENHKDRRVPELVDLLKRISSEYVGACVDTGNSIALLEEPMAVVEGLAPWAMAVHLKDMAVKEYDEGFLLSEVPLGEGLLDLKAIVSTLRRANPKIHFSLEMITRDPLKVPCLTEKYWATMGSVPGRDLARTLATVRAKAPKGPLPRVAGLGLAQRLKTEDDNVRKCLAFARSELGL
jgi:sugar phosphate isomerase/epimerase